MRRLSMIFLIIVLTGCSMAPAEQPAPTTTQAPVTITRTDFPNGG